MQFLQQEVTRVMSTILDVQRQELWAYNGLYIPTFGTLQPGERFIEQYQRDYTGVARPYNGVSTDIPLVNVTLGSNNYKTATWIIGAEWNQFDLHALEQANRSGILNRSSIIDEKMTAMSKVIAEGINKAVIFGTTNFKGFVNNTNVTVQVESATPYTMTPAALYEYFRGVVDDFRRDARLKREQLTLLVPPALYTKLGALVDTTNYMTPYKLLTDPTMGQSFGSISEVDELSFDELEANGVQNAGTNRDRFIIYHNAPETISRETYPMQTTTVGQSWDRLHYSVTGYQGTSEVMVKEPLRIRYYTIAKP